MTTYNILILNGPGLSGSALGEIEETCRHTCQQSGAGLDFRQSDDETEITRWLEIDAQEFSGIIISPVANKEAATFDFERLQAAITSIAHLNIPIIEVHLENIFLTGSNISAPLKVPESDAGFIAGLGIHGYLLAIQSLATKINI